MTWSNGLSLPPAKYNAQVAVSVYNEQHMEINHECMFLVNQPL